MHLKASEVCTPSPGLPHYSLICNTILFLKVRPKSKGAEMTIAVLPMLQSSMGSTALPEGPQLT